MRSNFTLLMMLLFVSRIFAQAPEGFKYQTLVRDTSGDILSNQAVSFRLSLVKDSLGGPSVYSETHTATTNPFGLVNLNVGSGSTVIGSIAAINWGSGAYFLKVELDPAGGSAYSLMGVSQLLSVPYALYAKSAGSAGLSGSGSSSQVAFWSSGTTLGGNNNLWWNNTSSRLGIGTATPAEQLEITGNLRLPGSTATTGVIMKGSDRFLSNFGIENTFLGQNSGNPSVSGTSNTAVGRSAMAGITSGSNNVGIGYASLNVNTTGYSNTAVGTLALQNNTEGYNNTALGNSSLYYNTSGIGNSAAGAEALFANSTGEKNTAMGYRSLYNNTTGNDNTAVGYGSMHTNTTGNYNAAFGRDALYYNTTGERNVAMGYGSLNHNTTGWYNTAVGMDALLENTTGFGNTGVGHFALFLNTTGAGNTAIGQQAMRYNTTGANNTAIGQYSMYHNDDGSWNTSIGNNALYNSVNGSENTALGHGALANNNNWGNVAVGYASGGSCSGQRNTFIGTFSEGDGDFNTALGAQSGVYPGYSYSNSTALGAFTITNASNQVRVGNSAITSIGGYVGWTTLPSDARYKSDVRENVPGLNFILSLRPVTYHLRLEELDNYFAESGGNKKSETDPKMAEFLKKSRTDKENRAYSGFIAQEVEAAAKTAGYDFSGIDIPSTEGDVYGLRYAEFVVPLVKAVQEQQLLIIKMQQEIELLKARNKE